MRSFIVAFIVLVLSATAGGMAQAADITSYANFVNGVYENVNLLSWGGNSVSKLEGFRDTLSWEHYFDLAPDTKVTGGKLKVWFEDDERDSWWNPRTWEAAYGYLLDDPNKFALALDIDTGVRIFDIGADLLADGKLGVKVRGLFGDFKIKKAALELDTKPVPLPGAMWLLGAGLLGVLGFRRQCR